MDPATAARELEAFLQKAVDDERDAPLLPWQMTRKEFRRAHPATRLFQKYDHNQRADRQASFRLGYQQRQSVGEYFYIHPMAPGLAFPTHGRAVAHAYRNVVRGALAEGKDVPMHVLAEFAGGA